MSRIWAEIWTRPGHPDFGRVIDDVGETQGSFHVGLNQVGDGTMVVPDTFDRFDEILLSDPDDPGSSVSSLVRLFSERDPDEPIAEWLPNQLIPPESKDDATDKVSGLGMNAVLGYARLEAFDWDGSDEWAPVQPDWQFGTGTNLLQNPGFENQSFPNGGFELGNTNYWQLTEGDGFLAGATEIIAVEDPGGAQAGDFYGVVNPGPNNLSGATRTFSNLVPGTTYTITGYLNDPTASGDRWVAGVTPVMFAIPPATNTYFSNGYMWAELDNAASGTGSSDGTWQSFTLSFIPLEDQITLVIVYDDAGTPLNFRLDSWLINGGGLGLAPWYIDSDSPGSLPPFVPTFEIDTTFVHEGLQSAKARGWAKVPAGAFGFAGFNYPGVVQDVNLNEGTGKTYTIEAWVYQASGSDQSFALSLRRRSKTAGFDTGSSAGTVMFRSGNVTVPTATWTKLVATGVADVDEVSFRLNWKYTGSLDNSYHQSPIFYVDECSLYEGLPATTLGDILGRLFRHATNPKLRSTMIVWDDGSGTDTSYLKKDFDNDFDSAGQPWDTAELTIHLTMRMSYSQIMAEFARAYGYEYRVVPKNVENGTWDWQVYNPGTMLVDYTAAISPAVQGGASDIRRGIRRFSPAGTDYMVEGADRVTGRDQDPALMAALGRIEAAELNRQVTSTDSAREAATSAVESGVIAGRSYSYVLGGDLQDEPLTDYQIGDLLNIIDPPEISEATARFVDVNVSYSPNGVEWAAEYGAAEIVSPDAAVADAVAGLLTKFEYPDEIGGGGAGLGAGGGGGMMSIAIAAYNASDLSKSKADLVAVAEDATTEILSAIDTLYGVGFGTIWLSEGHFFILSDQVIVGGSIAYPVPMMLRGLGEKVTVVRSEAGLDYSLYVSTNCEIRDFTMDSPPGGD